MADLELLTYQVTQMTIESTNDNTPTAPAITYSDCYRLPFLSLFHADCMDIMKQYPDKYFDLAIVDPPYGINVTNQTIGGSSLKKYKKETEWDKQIPTEKYWNELFRVSKNQIVWGANYFNHSLEQGNKWLVWDKMLDIDSSHFEMAWTSFKGADRFIRYSRSKEQGFQNPHRFHPTSKPVYLYDKTIMFFAKPNFKILDTHFGSGSIALAVDKANRLDKMNLHLTACEIDKEYIDKAIKRISESIKQGTLSF